MSGKSGSGRGGGNERVHRPVRALASLRERLRDSFWFAPTAGLVAAFVLWWVLSELDSAIVAHLKKERAYEELGDLLSFALDARTVVTTVSAAMMTFIGVVFSISLVAVQMASGQLTPRLVRIFVRSRISKLTLTVFLATFAFSLLVLTSYEGGADPDPRRVTSVPLLQSLLTLGLVGLSLLLFVAYVSATLRLMQVGPVLDHITRESLRALARHSGGPAEALPLGPVTARIVHRGRAGVLREVRVQRLVRAAERQGTVLRLLHRTGDFVVTGTPFLTVHGGAEPPARAVRRTLLVGVERAQYQDPAFGLRQLSDIALRALSPSVHDPTTAVQCLDRIVQFLSAAVHLPLRPLLHRDRRGAVRLVQDVPGWTDLVDLSFEEIRWCAAGNPQVTRRMLAALDDLLLLAAGEERKEPLRRHRALLVRAVERTVPEAADRAFALRPDRQGIR